MTHVCTRNVGCLCSISALEPNDDCPVHSGGEWPPRCQDCGRFMRWNTPSDLRQFLPDGDLLSPDDWDVGLRD
jgi:hypothetical protein